MVISSFCLNHEAKLIFGYYKVSLLECFSCFSSFLNNLFLNVHHSNSPRRRGSFLCCLLAARLCQTRGVNPNRKRHLVCGILSRCSQHFFEVVRYFSANLRENHFVKHNASDSVPFVSAARFPPVCKSSYDIETGPVTKPWVHESGSKRKMNTFALPRYDCACWSLLNMFPFLILQSKFAPLSGKQARGRHSHRVPGRRCCSHSLYLWKLPKLLSHQLLLTACVKKEPQWIAIAKSLVSNLLRCSVITVQVWSCWNATLTPENK